MIWFRRLRRDEDREDVVSDGPVVSFNWLQQREVDDTERRMTPVEEFPTTDPYGIVDG